MANLKRIFDTQNIGLTGILKVDQPTYDFPVFPDHSGFYKIDIDKVQVSTDTTYDGDTYLVYNIDMDYLKSLGINSGMYSICFTDLNTIQNIIRDNNATIKSLKASNQKLSQLFNID